MKHVVNPSSYAPMIAVTRGEITESFHWGAAAVVDINGHLVASYGDPQLVTFLRSSSKPIQALPLIELGGKEAYQLSAKEISLMCASHRGMDIHVDVLTGLHQKTGLSEEDLMCGVHPIPDRATAEALLLKGEQPSQKRHNCSGKHTGFLIQALIRGLPTENYIDLQHPVQQLVLKTFAEMCALPEDQIQLGTDGCSVPVYAVPLLNAGLAFASLCDPLNLSEKRAEACRVITGAMTAEPDMVAGPGQFDSELMKAGAGSIISKGGAEGYQAIGLLPGAMGENSPALGIVYKISDGDAAGRARPLVGVEILRQLGALPFLKTELLAGFDARRIYNWRKVPVGEIKPVFQLEFH